MALAYYQDAGAGTAPLYEAAARLSADESAHVATYRKFVRFARLAAVGAPLLLAFALYWTT